MKQKLLLLILGVLLSLPAMAHDFEYTYEGQTITYTVIDEDAKTCKTKEGKNFTYEKDAGNKISGKLILPSTPKNGDIEYKLEKIGINGFYNLSELTSVVIPNSVTSIGSSAFSNCYGLTSVEIPNSVTSIEGYAFKDCQKLTSLEIPNSVTYIGGNAFEGCSGLTSVVIPTSVTNINPYTFSCCRELTSVVIPNSVTSIGYKAFAGCSGLTSVVISNSVTSIMEEAFAGCNSLVKIAYPNNLKNPFSGDLAISYNPEGAIIEDGWIWGPDKSAIYFAPLSLEGEYSIPETVTSIGNRAFSYCNGLTSIEIPNSVTSIGEDAFYSCTGLTSVIIGNSVTSIGKNAFNYCNNLKKSAYPNNLKNPFYVGIAISYDPKGAIIEDGWLWGTDKSAIYFAPLSLEGEFTIPETVTSIGEYAFAGTHVTKLITNYLKPSQPYSNSFIGLYDEVIVVIPSQASNSYLTTSWSLFKNIQTDAGIALKTFSDGVLNYRLNPTDMTASVIGAESFNTLQIPERFTDDSDTANPVRYYIKGIGYSAFKDKNVNSVEFNSRSQIEYIGNYAFAGNNFSSITLPETVNYIGESAFKDSRISSITIPEKVTEINDSSFYNCIYLKDVTLNNSIVSIGASAFSMDQNRYNGNQRYGSLTIPSSLKHIGDNAFLYRALDKVVISDLRAWCDIDFSNNDSNPCGWAPDGFWLGENEIVNLVIPEGVTEIKPYSFITVAKILSVALPASVTSIGAEAFYFNNHLTSINFPNNLKTIGDRAFYQCNISELSIPASVEYIGHEAFITWSYPGETASSFTKFLTSLTLEDGLNPIEIEADAFAIPTDYTGDNIIRYNTPEKFYMGRPLATLPDGFKENLTDLTVGNTIVNIPASMCATFKLSNLKLGSSLKEIGDDAFRGCSFSEVIVPPTVETIGASAFAGNSKLESIIMGHSVKTIGEKAFDGCPANSVSITAQIPPTAPNNTFSKYSGKLFVQGEKAKDAYYDAYTCWDRFDSYVMIDAEGIKLEGADKISGKAGDTFQLTATIWPENVTLPQIFWCSTNPEIATVDQNGLVTLLVDIEIPTRAQGDADIDGLCTIIAETLYNDGPIAQVGVTAEEDKPILVESLTIDPTEWTGEEGAEFKINVTVLPEDAADKNVAFESSDASVATVDAEGNVKVLKEGTCVITVVTLDGSGLKAECVVTSTSGVAAIFADQNALVDVYNMNGIILKRACTLEELKQLKSGIYIMRSGDKVVKAVIND